MHFAPTPAERAHFATMDAEEKRDYFLSRTLETEEIWGLADGSDWLVQMDGNRSVLAVWPYEILAREYADPKDADREPPKATALESFLEWLEANQSAMYVDLMPMRDQPATRLSASELLAMYESLMDAGTYFLEG